MNTAAVPMRSPGDGLPPEPILFGSTPAMTSLQQQLQKIAGTNIPVLLEGESGTGKEVLANYIHQFSAWADGPFVKVNCPAIPGTLVESELFGYERGAFTGAFGSKPGRVEMADTGTLFLDEISELAFNLQSKLLQLLQDGQFCPIGAREDRKVNIRVICATNRHLEREVAAGRFRQDLFYRITGVVLRVPPLRDRACDIPGIASYFIALHSRAFQRRIQPLSPSTMALLQAHDWPGNIRELENLLKRYVVLGTEDTITNELRSRSLPQFDPEIPLGASIALKKVRREAIATLESRIILNALQANQWNRRRTARALNISYRSLLYKLKKANLESSATSLDRVDETQLED